MPDELSRDALAAIWLPSMAAVAIFGCWCFMPARSGLRPRTASGCFLPPSAAGPASVPSQPQTPAPRALAGYLLKQPASHSGLGPVAGPTHSPRHNQFRGLPRATFGNAH